MEESCHVYVINFKDDARRQKMAHRFKSVGMDAHFVDPVTIQDPRITSQPVPECEKRDWSIFFQNVDSLKDFVERSTYDYAIVCEDDVMISKHLKTALPKVVELYKKCNLDILLLSYLWPYDVPENHYFPVLYNDGDYKIQGYPDDLWGAHMYFLSKAHAKTLLERYTPEYAIQQKEIPFCTDWQITKQGRRGLIIPMLGLEEGEVKTDHQGQIDFHKQCFEYNYKPDVFL